MTALIDFSFLRNAVYSFSSSFSVLLSLLASISRLRVSSSSYESSKKCVSSSLCILFILIITVFSIEYRVFSIIMQIVTL